MYISYNNRATNSKYCVLFSIVILCDAGYTWLKIDYAGVLIAW